ncbi:MAG: site-2 protease family protein [Clostridia bacterium]|nr:site-2 protease family protein [Clostridia bacterium]
MNLTANILAKSSGGQTFFGILLAIAILLAMITIHEFGHYVAGKILGFKINEFSIGFGPALFKKRSKKTGEIFALRLIPLGGYCAFDGEDEIEEFVEEKRDEDGAKNAEEPFEEMQAEGLEEGNLVAETVPEEEYPEPKGERFNDQAPWKRIIVLIAGATMNYLLALFLIITMFACFGRPVYQVVKNPPPTENPTQTAIDTYNSGLQTGDIILEINGKNLYLITDYMSVLDGKNKGDVVDVLVIRNGEKQTVEVTLVEDSNPRNMSDSNSILFPLGLATREEVENENGELKMTVTRGGGLAPANAREGFFPTVGKSFVYSFKIGTTVLRSLGELVTGKLGMEAVGGPATTITVTAEQASNGVQEFLSIAALIGVNLAVFNLLPVPALDGCKIIFCIIEWIRKKPLNRKVEAIINFAGLIVLFGFAILVDVLHFLH